MSLVLKDIFGSGMKIAKVYRDAEWEEYRVRFYIWDVHQEAADYHTDDYQDAKDTASHWANTTS